MTDERRRYIVLPAQNAFNVVDETPSVAFSRKLARLDAVGDDLLSDLPASPVERIDGDVATVVEMTETERLALAALYPGLQIAIEGELRMLPIHGYRHDLKTAKAPKATAAKALEITVLLSGAPLAGADVVVVFDTTKRTGQDGLTTDANGKITVALPPRRKVVDLVIATPRHSAWPVHLDAVPVPGAVTSVTLDAQPIAPDFADGLARLTGMSTTEDGQGVRVAVIDGGASGAADLNIAFALNTTDQEAPGEVQDNGSGHGTHVASIVRRLAPAAEIYSYRVFVGGATTAREAAIARAIRDAVDRGCDLINLSLGQMSEPIAIIREVRRAGALGSLCVAAAGNDFGGAVNYPARSTYVKAVSAIGSLAGWPSGSARDLDVDEGIAEIGDVFFASFSNRGPEIALTMPGAGIVAAVAPNHLGVMSGTSMACPAAVGMIARLLSQDDRVRTMNRDQTRSDEIAKLAATAARPVGFGPLLEGQGRLA